MTESRYCEIVSKRESPAARQLRNPDWYGGQEKKAGADMSILDTINQLKKERDAVILAHYYVNDEVQAIAD